MDESDYYPSYVTDMLGDKTSHFCQFPGGTLHFLVVLLSRSLISSEGEILFISLLAIQISVAVDFS